MMRKISATISGARPKDGSSSSSSLGRSISARLMASICCSPPDSVPACWWRRCLRIGKRVNMRSMSSQHLGLVAAHVGAQAQVLLDRQAGEGAAAVGHVGHAHAHHRLGGLAHQLLAVELDAAAGLDHLAQRAQRGRLAGAVGAEDGGDVAGLEREVHVVQHLRRAVRRAQLVHFQELRHWRGLPDRPRSRPDASGCARGCLRRSCGRSSARRCGRTRSSPGSCGARPAAR